MNSIMFELSINLIESYLMIDFISRFNGFKYFDFKRNLFYTVSILILFCNVTIANYIETIVEIPSYIALLIMIIYSMIALNGRFIVKILSCILFTVALILINSLSVFAFGLIFFVDVKTMVTTFGIYRIACLLSSKIILFYISRIILKLKIKQYENNPASSWMFLTIIPIMTIFIMVVITESAIYTKDSRTTFYLILSIVGLIIMNILFYYLFVSTGRKFEIITENELLKQNIKLQMEHSFEARKLYKEIQIIKHDMKNHLISIRSCLDDGNYCKSIDYLNNMIKDIEKTKKLVFTKNDMFNAIVNNKFSEANSKGIKTSYFINYELDGKVEDTDISILFGNLLSNAIEACEKIKGEKEISLFIDKKREYIYIEVNNTIESSVLRDNPGLKTTKTDKNHHGLGIKSIKNIVKKYDGIINYRENGNLFTSNILLLKNRL